MSKKKSQQQQLSYESESAVINFFSNKHKWIVDFPKADYGTDGFILVFEGEKHDQKKLDFQLKATSTGVNKLNIKIDDLKVWNESILPFFLFFWNQSEDQIYFVNIHEYYSNLSRSVPEKLEKNKSILINFTQKLDDRSFEEIKNVINRNHEIVKHAFREHARKRIQIQNISGLEQIMAMGYSFSNQDMRGQNLREAMIMGATFERADLSTSDMRGVKAMTANFNEANLKDCDLRSGSFMGAYFEHSNLQGVKLEGAAFMGAFILGADFRGISFNDTTLWSISKANDFERASYDDGVLKKIKSFQKFNSNPSRNTAPIAN